MTRQLRWVYLLIPIGLLRVALLGRSPAAAASEARRPISITYLGNAGWQIDDGQSVILVDPVIICHESAANIVRA
jgi:hypothetical protein